MKGRKKFIFTALHINCRQASCSVATAAFHICDKQADDRLVAGTLAPWRDASRTPAPETSLYANSKTVS